MFGKQSSHTIKSHESHGYQRTSTGNIVPIFPTDELHEEYEKFKLPLARPIEETKIRGLKGKSKPPKDVIGGHICMPPPTLNADCTYIMRFSRSFDMEEFEHLDDMVFAEQQQHHYKSSLNCGIVQLIPVYPVYTWPVYYHPYLNYYHSYEYAYHNYGYPPTVYY